MQHGIKENHSLMIIRQEIVNLKLCVLIKEIWLKKSSLIDLLVANNLFFLFLKIN